jgi:5,10-methenyltetrahydrofolate synthetase
MPENKMGTEPIGKLLLTMSAPLMVSNLVQALYNIVDSIFVAMINEKALTAVTLAFPVQMLIIAFAIGTSVGMSALLSRYLGAGMMDKVNKVAHNGLILAGLNYLLFVLFGFLAEPFFRMQTDDPVIIQYATDYLSIVCWLSFGSIIQISFERLLQSTGKTKFILFSQSTGAIINIIADPILIFGYFGAPAMGVKGAAVATIFGQICGAVLGFIFNIKYNKEITLKWSSFKPDLKIMKEIYGIALPSIVMQSIGSVMNFTLNQILIKFTPTAVAAFGVYYKLQSFVFMPIFGMNNGVVPIAAYNFGARKKDRLEEVMRVSVRIAILIMGLGTVIFWVFPHQLLAIFSASDELVAVGTVALRTISLVFPLAAFCIMRGAIFQALGKSIYSMYISIARQLLVLTPVAWLLGQLGNVNYVWLAFPIAEGVGVGMSIMYTKRIRRKIIDRLGDEKVDVKKLLREDVKERREKLSREYMSKADAQIRKALFAQEEFKNAKTLMLYLSTDREVSTDLIVQECFKQGKRVCVPLCTNTEEHLMEARLITGESDLKLNKYGIKEPQDDAPAVDKSEIDLAIIPCVSCDVKRNRLGHGAGYYDRFLEKTTFAKYALCYEKLMSEDVPVYGNDVSMDVVITESNVYKKGR